jgi:hypothetical protein
MNGIQLLHPNFFDTLREFIEAEVNRVLQGQQPNTNASDEYLTIKQTCKYLKVTAPTLWEWSRRGVITKHYIVGQPRYKKSEIDSAFISLTPKSKRR